MRNKEVGYNQLMIVDNTKENHSIIKELNKKMKEFNSRWRISKKYRLPKEGCKYGYGGSLCKDDANGVGIYLYTTPKYNKLIWEERQRYYRERRTRETEQIQELQTQNRLLANELQSYHKKEEIDYLNKIINSDEESHNLYGTLILERIKSRLK